MSTFRVITVGACAALALAGCQDRYGRTDYIRTGVLGAGVGAGVGLLGAAIAGDQGHRRSYGYGGYGYSARPSSLPPIAGSSFGQGFGW